jgi:hypothetical protein
MCPPPGSQCPSNSTGVTGGVNGNCTTSTCSSPGQGCVPACPQPIRGTTGCGLAFPSVC